MAIYIRGDATLFILTAKVDDGIRLVGYWSDDSKKQPHVTDRSRIVADGAAAEVEAVVSVLPLTTPCSQHGGSLTCSCGDPEVNS